MKQIFLPIAAVALLLSSCQEKPKQWELVWSDDFNGPSLDTTVWSRTERGTPDWANTQSKDERCLEMRDGMLVLRGIVNDNLETDTAAYLTGGVVTKGKKSFDPGRFEIRARLHGARGAWPAIWLMPYDGKKWPDDGEIDIMERLNNDSLVFQTVHSNYTYTLNRGNDPTSTLTSPIDRDGFNVYGVDMYPDSIVFHINGERTYAYPRIAEYADSLNQFPFYRSQYILIDMQLGGQWVGEVDPADLPVEMEVDWVKYYQLK